jgi:drug/metabolite transporter (DMT)-like permease
MSSGHTPAQRRHSRRVLLAAIAYAAVLIPSVYLVRQMHVGQPWQTVLAILSALPVVAMFASYGRYLSEESDEYQRMLVVRRILTATTVTMCLAVVWGFVTELGGMTPIASYWLAVVWIAMQGAQACAEALFGRSYGDDR